jgi:hypothetical protein
LSTSLSFLSFFANIIVVIYCDDVLLEIGNIIDEDEKILRPPLGDVF